MHVLSSASAMTSHAPAEIFALWADPTSWQHWNSEVRTVLFAGKVGVGANGQLRPRSGPIVRFWVTDCEPNHLFTLSTFMRGATVTYSHTITPTEAGSEIAVTVSIEGGAARLWARLLRRLMGRFAPASVAGVIALLDAR